ncbi:MAG: PEP-CTERM sorting domain-containing protein [Spirochaetia bacterium]|nr:MAG: PEP-CTERM sorting domain-containing protein [Spirochaetia bacterium]
MKRFALLALASGMAIAAAAPASAATTVTRCDSGNGVMNSAASCNIVFDGTAGTFGNANVTVSPFVDIYTFDIATAGNLGLTLSSIASSGPSDINFSLVRLNPPGGGNNVMLAQGSTGTVEFYSLSNLNATAGTYTLRLAGTVAGAPPSAAYSGTISFAQTAAVPEPATWAMMTLGFGAMGFAMRRKAKASTRIRFA